MTPTVEFVAAAPQRLDAALAERPEVVSRARAQRLLEAGAVTVDGALRPKSHRLAPGERVVVTLPGEPPRQSRSPPQATCRSPIAIDT